MIDNNKRVKVDLCEKHLLINLNTERATGWLLSHCCTQVLKLEYTQNFTHIMLILKV